MVKGQPNTGRIGGEDEPEIFARIVLIAFQRGPDDTIRRNDGAVRACGRGSKRLCRKQTCRTQHAAEHQTSLQVGLNPRECAFGGKREPFADEFSAHDGHPYLDPIRKEAGGPGSSIRVPVSFSLPPGPMPRIEIEFE